MGKIRDVQVKLHMDENAIPIFKKARPVPFAIEERYNEELEKLEKQGIIQKVEFSEWASPVVPVVKPNSNKIRICGDYACTINKHLISDVYPLPSLEDIVNKIGYGEYFTKLDLSQAFHQFMLHPDSRKYTTINTKRGLFEYLRLVFGITPATAICQRYMENLLRGVPGQVVRVDDVLITGISDEDHLKNMRVVLEKFKEKGLKLCRSKVQFMMNLC